MIKFLSAWTIDLVIFITIISFLEMILPSGNIRKFVKMTIGLIIILVIINPFIKLVQGDIDIEKEVFKNLENQYNYRESDYSVFKTNQNVQVKEIYTQEIEREIERNIIDETKYVVHESLIEIDESEQNYGQIMSIELVLGEKNNQRDLRLEKENNIKDIKIDINIKQEVISKEANTVNKKEYEESKDLKNIRQEISKELKIPTEKIFLNIQTKE